MAKKTKKKLSDISANWSALIAGTTLIGIGVGAGAYVANVFHKIEMNKVFYECSVQIQELKEENRTIVWELKNENQSLKNQIELLKNGTEEKNK